MSGENGSAAQLRATDKKNAASAKSGPKAMAGKGGKKTAAVAKKKAGKGKGKKKS